MSNSSYLYQRPWFWLLVIAIAGGVVGYELWRGGRREADSADEEFKPRRYIIPQAPVTELEVVPVAEVGARLASDDLVVGATIAGQSRAYPLKMLEGEPRTKVLNDTLGGEEIVATWCEECASAAIYERVVDGKKLTMQVFGSIWRDSLIMHDQETGSQWSQWDGVARSGPLTGRTLTRVASAVLAWGEWKSRHPDGSVVLFAKEQPVFDPTMYAAAENYVVVLGAGRDARAWSLADVRDRGVINDMWNETPVALVFLESSGTARAFGRSLKRGVVALTRADGVLHDEATNRRWAVATGASLDETAGGDLPAIPCTVTTRKAWKLFNP